ncbi:hypothetical protein H7H78_02495 [Mycobacterium shinjukuense]|uniref:hypothetical protein n=1 Tax=Mycobacterium shinjukuense TaxID=398694 RepID=UPI00130203D0|nr:hypothetical protein [Mycobacterium shinjukuense]MCV6984356.1 hypothetical protein [Mycobacterium shinjukuense]
MVLVDVDDPVGVGSSLRHDPRGHAAGHDQHDTEDGVEGIGDQTRDSGDDDERR